MATKKYTVRSLCDAARTGQLDRVKVISETVDVNKKDIIGWTPLHWAVLNSQREVVDFLLSKGANTDVKGFEGHTALMFACSNGDIHTVKALVKAGCDIRETNKNNENAVDIAARRGRNNVRDYLREALKQTDKFSSNELQKKYKDDEKQELVKTCAARGFVGGNYEFGKSSLVRSLISNSPYLMDEEDRTVVVDIRLWNISTDVTVPMYDIGGHPCYQQVAHLFHSDAVNNINVIPHDITSKDYVTTYQWVTDVLMRSPKSTVELVLTKSDKIIWEDERKQRNQFTTYMKTHLERDYQMALEKAKRQQRIPPEKQKTIDKYKEIARNIESHVHIVSCKVKGDRGFKKFRDAIIKKINSDKFKVKMPASALELYQYLGKLGVEKKQRKIIQPGSPLNEQETQQETQPAISLNEQETQIKVNKSNQRSSSFSPLIKIAETMNKEEKNKKQVQFITFKEAEEIMRKQVQRTSRDVTEDLKRCLRCLHQNGLLLWFEHSADLIFNDIGSFVNLLKSLFHHNLDEVFSYDSPITQQIAEPTFQNYTKQLQEEGLLSVHLLSVFAKRFEFQEHVNALIDILKDLNIAIKTDHPDFVYFPWYVSKTPNVDDIGHMIKDVKSPDQNSHCLHLRLSGSLPSAFFNYFTVSMFNYLDPASRSQVRKVWKDGFFANINKTKIFLELNQCKDKNQIDIYIKSPIGRKPIAQAWKVVENSDKEIDRLIANWWPGMMAELYLLCRHCEDAILCNTAHCGKIYHWPLKGILSKNCEKEDVCYCHNKMENSFPSVLIHPLPQVDDEIKACLEELKEYNSQVLRLSKQETPQESANPQHVQLQADRPFPTDIQMFELAKGIGAEKLEMAAYLGISKEDVERIEMDHVRNELNQISAILVRWRDRSNLDPEQSCRQLKRCFRQCGRERLVVKVQQFYEHHPQITEASTSTPTGSLDQGTRTTTEASTSTPTGSLDQGTHASPAIPRPSVMQDQDIGPISVSSIELTTSESSQSLTSFLEEVQSQDHRCCCTVL